MVAYADMAMQAGHLLSALKDEPSKALLVMAILAAQEALASIEDGKADGANASRIYLAEAALRAVRIRLASAGIHPCTDRLGPQT